jgi:hypothetical protein
VLALSTVAAAALCAAPSSIEQCVAASDEGQRLQHASRLTAARTRFETCSQSSCPGLVREACTRWLDEVLAATPTLIVVARLDGVDLREARVRLDGDAWLDALSGRPEPVDPGEHRVAVELNGASAEQRLLVNAAEKNRLVLFTLQRPAAQVEAPPPAASTRPSAALPTTLTAGAVIGLGLFAVLGLAGRQAEVQLLNRPCADTKTCDPDSVAAIRRTWAAADVSLTVGVVCAGLAVWRWWAWWKQTDLSVAVSPTGRVTVRGSW